MKKILFLLLSSILLVEISKYLFDFDKLIYSKLIDNVSNQDINLYINNLKKWRLISQLFLPFLILIKVTIIGIILYIGTFFYSKTKVTFKQLFDAVVKAEFVFLGVGVLKIVWFYFFQTSYTLEDLQYFYPLSALNIVGYKGLDNWFIYPLQTLNLFELAYWLLLAYFIGKLAFTEKDKGKPMDLGFKIVASSYGSALLLWVVVVMFFTLNYS